MSGRRLTNLERDLVAIIVGMILGGGLFLALLPMLLRWWGVSGG